CGLTLTCNQAAAPIERTPIPTLIPATMPAMKSGSQPAATSSDKCRVAAADLIGAWVSANAPETNAFQFTDADGQHCEATFAEVDPLFKEPNFWYPGSLSCVSCHSADVTISLAQLDLSSYAGIQSGSRRADATAKGTDVLGGGKWDKSLLYQFLSQAKADVPGHATIMSKGYFVNAGKPLPAPTATPKP
ncbi:MAG: hypothetical protein PHQ36_11075, partial [Anaerolineales bacterium]|nr:hypothetical protein [Anaerolineales bacterium]